MNRKSTWWINGSGETGVEEVKNSNNNSEFRFWLRIKVMILLTMKIGRVLIFRWENDFGMLIMSLH